MARESTEQLLDMPEARKNLALKAAWEIEALANMGIRENGCKYESSHLAMHGILMRMRELSSIVMSALDDEMSNPDDLSYSLDGKLLQQPGNAA